MTTLAPPPSLTPADAPRVPDPQSGHVPAELRARAEASLRAAVDALFRKQHADGHWCAELEGDSITITEYLLMKWILGQEASPQATPRDLELFRKMCVTVRRLQRADGTWGQYPGSPPDLSATVKAYFTLKLFGDDRDAAHMVRARDAVLRMGGAEKINTFSMFYLACLGQVSWEACPAIPPEAVLLPRWFPFHLTKVAAWTRTMILPLALCSALRPVRGLPSHLGIGELFIDHSKRERLAREWDKGDPTSWNNIFLAVDRVLKWAQRRGLTPLRALAMRKAESWLLERMTAQTTEGLGAIFPPMVYIQVAFKALGYGRDHPVIRHAEHELDRFIVEEEDHVRVQPCFSPVWDSGIALYALTEAGLTAGKDARIDAACRWLADREIALVGDWVANLRPRDRELVMGPGGDAGAWAFEYRNDWYPDNDDTAMVCKALWRAGRGSATECDRYRTAARRGVRWILAMQNDDGGWAAFDRTRDRAWMEAIPFADHNAMQDPSCADITGRVLEALVTCGVERADPAVRRAVNYLRTQQRTEGCWWGRWGCNFLYGTWQAVGGLVAVGEDPASPMLTRTLMWLRSVQNDDGGFGESANSYLDESLMGRGPSTASQTAWGVISMMNILGERAATDPGVRAAIAYLCRTQLARDTPKDAPDYLHEEPAGSWREKWYTGTGFPKVYYLRYHMYRHYFPVIALARFARIAAATSTEPSGLTPRSPAPR